MSIQWLVCMVTIKLQKEFFWGPTGYPRESPEERDRGDSGHLIDLCISRLHVRVGEAFPI